MLKFIVLGLSPMLAIASPALGKPGPTLIVDATPTVIDPAAQVGSLAVEMKVPEMQVANGDVLARLVLGMPGQAQPHRVSSFAASDSAGAITVEAESGITVTWKAGRDVSGDVTIRYTLELENIAMLQGGPPMAVRVDGQAFSGIGAVLFAEPNISAPVAIAVRWHLDAMPEGALAVTSFGDGDVELPAGPPQRLSDAVYMVGPVFREPLEGDVDGFSSVWADDPGFDPRPVMRWTADLHSWMSDFFGDETAPPYRVFMRFNPMNAGGGAALYNSFMITYGKNVTGESLKDSLGHELTHTWTAQNVGKWYDEGNAVFYQALLPWRAGLLSTDEYLADINSTASRYYTNLLWDTPEEEAIRRFWEDTRVRVLPYDRGAMYFARLNGMLHEAKGSRKSIDELILEMNGRAKNGLPVNEEVWLDLLRRDIGEKAVKLHEFMLAGGLVLPKSGDFGPCFRRTTQKIRRFDVGFDFASLIGLEKVVRGLKPGSEAAKVGLREGDRINYRGSLDALQAEADRLFTVEVTREGITFPITYLPRGEFVKAYQWERDGTVPESVCRAW